MGPIHPRPGAAAAPAASAAVLALLALTLGWRGADWPAQLLRLELVDRDGPTIWNNLWFSGHHTPGYGVLFPVLGAAFGAPLVAVVSCVAAAASFQALASGYRRATAASVLFAAGTVVNVAVGRLTFALGLAIGLAAVAALRRRRLVLGLALTLLTAPASPVAGVLLALALTAWALHARRPRLLCVAGLAVAPIGVAMLLFPQGGHFPFRLGALCWSLAVVAVVSRGNRRAGRPVGGRAVRGGLHRDVPRAQPARRQRHAAGHVLRCAGPRAHGPTSSHTDHRHRPDGDDLVAVVAWTRRDRARRPRSVVNGGLSPTTDQRRAFGGRPCRTHRGRPDATALGDDVRRRRGAPGTRLGTTARHGAQPAAL